jgi:ribonuclease P protein component
MRGRDRDRACGLHAPQMASCASPGSAPLYWPAAARYGPSRPSDEENVPAERAPPEAEARVPGSHVDPGRPGYSQAAPRQGPQAAVGLTSSASAPMRRRHRLSRSRDFDAVYRYGKSVSTRYLVLHAFPRSQDSAVGDDPRLGLAVSRRVGDAVERNRIKRTLREAFAAIAADVPSACDYVLVVRPGLAESAQSRGFSWLVGRVREVFDLAPAGPEALHS